MSKHPRTYAPTPILLSTSQDVRALPNWLLQTFDVLKATTPGFAKRVPIAAFRYYCAVMTWARMLKIHSKNGFRSSFDEQDFVRVVEDANFQIPSPIAIYLSGFGNTSMPRGRDVMFSLFP